MWCKVSFIIKKQASYVVFYDKLKYNFKTINFLLTSFEYNTLLVPVMLN